MGEEGGAAEEEVSFGVRGKREGEWLVDAFRERDMYSEKNVQPLCIERRRSSVLLHLHSIVDVLQRD